MEARRHHQEREMGPVETLKNPLHSLGGVNQPRWD